jgi:RimJ/RimL family protein N-acetyltransferase
MLIRPATLADVPRLVEMGRQQMRATYGGVFADNPVQLEALATQLVETPTSIVFLAERDGRVVGMIGLIRYAHHLTAKPMVGEIMWWLDPEARGGGVALLKRAERWALETGAAAIQMMAPDARVGRLYERRGYQLVEYTYQAVVTPAMSAITVVDDVLPDVEAYRQMVLEGPFGDVETSPGVVFHGISRDVDGQLPLWIQTQYPSLTPMLTFARLSPAGQEEPHFIHTDRDMGDWTGILYLTADPPADDGTTFWRHRATGAVQSTACTGEALLEEWGVWREGDQWEPWHTVPAQANRLVLFPSPYFHSRAIPANYGTGEAARLIQVVFGTGVFPPDGGG